MENPSSDLIALGRALGLHEARLALHREGSCAAKLPEGRFLVTARGTALGRLEESDLVTVDTRKEARAEDEEGKTAPQPCEDAPIYAYLFSLEGIRFAAHVQPIEVNQILCSPRARQFSDRRTYHEEVLACGSSSVLVPYEEPGPVLVREVKRKTLLWRDRNKVSPKLVLLQNNGMIVLGKTSEEVLRTTEMTVKAAQIFAGAAMLGGPVFLNPTKVVELDLLKE